MTMSEDNQLDPTSKLIIEEAQRRGIAVEILSPRAEYFRLRHSGRVHLCRESLSDLTSAVAASRCDDKRITTRILRGAGLSTPMQIEAGDSERAAAFLHEYGSVAVKPARGEQGRGVSVGISSMVELDRAVTRAAAVSTPVLIEQAVKGHDLRLIVMGDRLVAASERRPPQVTGDGLHSIAELIARQSKKRAAETAGHSQIPVDDETRRCLAERGYQLQDILPLAETITVRGAANLHMGGTIHDVTERLHPELSTIARRAAYALGMSVVGLDLIVESISEQGAYYIIEANERPGLANHEPQPTAARFVDLLFPETAESREGHLVEPLSIAV
jgi:GNAT-family acetyltransferase (TIGR03103 family)